MVRVHSLAQWDDVDRALDSLRRQTHPPDQVVVVVDHHDQLLEWAADVWSNSGTDGGVVIDVVANTGTRGRVAARDAGIAWSRGDVIAFLDPFGPIDDRRWVEEMLGGYADHDVAGVVGGATVGWDLSIRREVICEVGGFGSSASGVDELSLRIRRRYPLARLVRIS